jgi:hypothetical protein
LYDYLAAVKGLSPPNTKRCRPEQPTLWKLSAALRARRNRARVLPEVEREAIDAAAKAIFE